MTLAALYDEWSKGDHWWYDARNNNNGKAPSVNHTDALHDLFSQGITTPQLLFQGSQVCANAAEGKSGECAWDQSHYRHWGLECGVCVQYESMY